MAKLLGALGGYMLASRAHNKYGNKDDSVEKYGSRYAGAAAGSVLAQALYNRATGKGWSLTPQYKRSFF